ncbi:prepilin peptidase [Streptomyces sp. NPDC056835]|uniref:prepilin peptidase n=1 Tax=Streptomyces sp. NPDC056835 TaxID=3345956 RepID=UPI0036A4AD9D
MYATLIVVAVLWGAATGLLLPRAAYRLSVEPEDPWRDSCPAGHPITGPAGGWLGVARCTACKAAEPSGTAESSGADVKSPGVGTGRTAAGADTSSTAGSANADTDEPHTQAPQAPQARAQARASAHAHASARYAPGLLVPLLTALVCAVLAAATGPRPELAVWLLLTPIAVLLALVDHAVHRLPDRLTLPLAVAAAVLLGLAALLPDGGDGGTGPGGTGPGGSWPTALLGGLVLGVCYFVLFLINPNGLGFGDVKLALSLGVALGWYGWTVLFVGAFAGFLLGSLYGFGLILLRRAGRKSAFPFGPFMIVGALTGIVLGALAAA